MSIKYNLMKRKAGKDNSSDILGSKNVSNKHKSKTAEVPFISSQSDIDSKKQSKKQFSDQETTHLIKKTIELLSFLYSKNKNVYEINQKIISNQISNTEFKKVSDVIEIAYSRKMLMNKCQIGVSSAFFFLTTLESLGSIWSAHTKYRSDVKSIVKSNLKKTNYCDRLYLELMNLNVKKECLVDEIEFCKDMWDIYYVKEDEDYFQFENEVWGILLSMPNESSLPIQLLKIDEFLTYETTSQIESQIQEYLVEGRKDKHIGLVLLNLGKRCLYLGAYDIGIKIIYKANTVLKQFFDPKSLQFNLMPFAEAFGLQKLNKKTEAINLLKNINQNVDNIEFANISEKGYVLLLIGYFMFKWDDKNNGFKLLKQAESLLENALPQSEMIWKRCTNFIARLHNDNSETDLAFRYLSKVLDYYHEKTHGPISKMNKPIHVVANEAKHISKASLMLMEILCSQMGYLPQSLMFTIRELIVTFALQKNINAVVIAEKYLNDSYKAYKDVLIEEEAYEGDYQAILNRLKYNTKDSFYAISNVKK